MINNSYIGIPLRAQIQGYYIGETQSGFPYVTIALRVIDNQSHEILNEHEGSFYGPTARFYLVSSKTGKTNAFAVNSLRHIFKDWDDSLSWFEAQPHKDEWFTVNLKANQDGTGYDIEYLYPLNGQPYKPDRPDISALAQKWDKFFKSVPRPNATQPETNVLPKKAKKGDSDDDVPF